MEIIIKSLISFSEVFFATLSICKVLYIDQACLSNWGEYGLLQRVQRPPKNEPGVNFITWPTELGWHRKLFLATGSKGELTFPAEQCHSQTFLILFCSQCENSRLLSERLLSALHM